MKKKLILISVLSVIIVSFVGYRWATDKKISQLLYISYGEEIPNFSVNENGERKDIMDVLVENKLNLVCYVSDQCNICLDELALIKVMQSYQEINNNFNIIVLWQDNIPSNRVVDIKNNYSLSNNIRLSDSIPNFFIIDQYKVNFQTADITKLLNKVFDNLDKNKLRREVIEQFRKELENKVTKLIFVTEDCLECLKELQKKSKNVLYISDYDNQDTIVDKYNFYSNLFEVYTYPGILDIDKNKY